MKQTHEPHFLRCVTGAFLVLGILMVFSSTTQLMQAREMSSAGTLLIHAEAPASEAVMMAATFHSPASAPQYGSDAKLRLMVGMLLILAGFGFHALSLVRLRKQAEVAARGYGIGGAFRRMLHRPLR